MSASPTSGPSPEDLDRVAAAALKHVSDGMRLGLGTGRAAEAFIRVLGAAVAKGLRVRGVPTSNKSAELCKSLSIETMSLADADHLDVAFDGADEVAPDLGLTKGLGGALLRERVVAFEAHKFIILVTPEKLVPKLGSRTHIPIEIVPFAAASTSRHLAALGGKPKVRQAADGRTPCVTDNGNWILDTDFGPIADPAKLDAAILRIPGVVDDGLFLGMAHLVLVGDPGEVRTLSR